LVVVGDAFNGLLRRETGGPVVTALGFWLSGPRHM
jgi:hypothetical protein